MSLTAALVLTTGLGLPASAPSDLILAQAQPYVATQGYVSPQSANYMTTADGCTYRRTQAPGYPPRWILVQNPHHLGIPPSRGHCKGMK
ncbi:hypothetical protein [Pseudoponticoccus marisrubri]|uniref:Secreted protein n=1 Tax=Pseudoponticoccus marisrubri TaxID=1685382 RepID=A0A0W7WM48_9RHOB|nr:hypothetical protein [Pseudoponticoccus marisrubri]KUF11666.1 hypothetical protein AVJ23_07915 [Pseudoponticoccus marisrubri]